MNFSQTKLTILRKEKVESLFPMNNALRILPNVLHVLIVSDCSTGKQFHVAVQQLHARQ